MSLQNVSDSNVAAQGQEILNSILRTFDVPFIDRKEDQTIRFGAYQHKENALSVSPRDSFLKLDLRDPERLLGVNFWHMAAGYAAMNVMDKRTFADHWNSVAKQSLQCDAVEVTGYKSDINHIQVVFDLRICDKSIIDAIGAVLSLTHLELKDENRPSIVTH